MTILHIFCECICLSRPVQQFSLSLTPKRHLNKLLFLCIKSVERYVIGSYFFTVCETACVRCSCMFMCACCFCQVLKGIAVRQFYSLDLEEEKKNFF